MHLLILAQKQVEQHQSGHDQQKIQLDQGITCGHWRRDEQRGALPREWAAPSRIVHKRVEGGARSIYALNHYNLVTAEFSLSLHVVSRLCDRTSLRGS